MSGRQKRLRARLGARAINGKVSVNQARARLGLAPLQGAAAQQRARGARETGRGRGQAAYQPAVAAKSAGRPAWPGEAPVPGSVQVYLDHSNPAVRGLAEAFLAQKGR